MLLGAPAPLSLRDGYKRHYTRLRATSPEAECDSRCKIALDLALIPEAAPCVCGSITYTKTVALTQVTERSQRSQRTESES